MLRDVVERDTTVELFGRTLPSPFLLAPVGVLEMAHRDADLAVARAARAEGVPMIFSNQASRPMEEVAASWATRRAGSSSTGAPTTSSSRASSRRAEACGCEAIVVTLDTTMLGWRTHDLDLAYLPFLRGKGIAQYTSDPVFRGCIASRPRRRQPEPRRQPRPHCGRWSQLARDLPATVRAERCAPARRAPPCRRSCASTRGRR